MGILKHEVTGRLQSLAARSLVGRAAGCALRLHDPCASAEHAVVLWTGARWEVRDLGSTNGTLVGGRRVDPGRRVTLRERADLAFGGGAERWSLVDASPPIASARREDTGETRAAEGGLLALPSAADPVASVFEHADGRWLLEIGDAARPAEDQERIDAGAAWLLSIPPSVLGGEVPMTLKQNAGAMPLAAMTLRFRVSRDEEHVVLSLALGEETIRLSPRAHNYMLLTLARARLADGADGSVPEGELGWLYIEDLMEMLKLDAQHLCVNIFRARQQLAEAGVLNAGEIVERRSTTRQIRLGTDRIEVETL